LSQSSRVFSWRRPRMAASLMTLKLPLGSLSAWVLLVACSGPRIQLPALVSFEQGDPAGVDPQEASPSRNSIWSDVRAAPGAIGRDLVDVYSSSFVWWTIAGGFAGSALVGEFSEKNAENGFFGDDTIFADAPSRALEEMGKGYFLLAGAGAWYLWSRDAEDPVAVAGSQHLMRSLATTGISTLVLKAVVGDVRPNGGSRGYPSGHTSMAVTAATSIWLTQGPKAGIPAAVVAGLIATQRLDSRAHELDDVLAGAVLGWVTAYSLEGRGPTFLGARVAPAMGPGGDPMISLRWGF
jgi:membrane-associated phospholipid phosphatase